MVLRTTRRHEHRGPDKLHSRRQTHGEESVRAWHFSRPYLDWTFCKSDAQRHHILSLRSPHEPDNTLHLEVACKTHAASAASWEKWSTETTCPIIFLEIIGHKSNSLSLYFHQKDMEQAVNPIRVE